MDRERLASAVEKQLQCPICLLKLKNPKLLECMHTFCQECLANVSRHSRLGGVFICCPTCRQRTKVSDVSKLHKNYIVQDIIDTMEQAQAEHKADEHECRDNTDGDINNGKTLPTEISMCMETLEISNNESSNVSLPASIGNSSEANSAWNFSLTPSFNFGEIDNTSFSHPTTTASSIQSNASYNFSVYSTIPSFTFGSIDKTSFAAPNNDQVIPTCNDQVNKSEERGTLAIATRHIPSSSAFNFNVINNTTPSYCWGSLEKTSFA